MKNQCPLPNDLAPASEVIDPVLELNRRLDALVEEIVAKVPEESREQVRQKASAYITGLQNELLDRTIEMIEKHAIGRDS